MPNHRHNYDRVLLGGGLACTICDAVQGPFLGMATTRELLEEIRARGETEPRYREEGDAMAIGAANLIDVLPGSMLDYRTVDS